jgi:hypothetical protein
MFIFGTNERKSIAMNGNQIPLDRIPRHNTNNKGTEPKWTYQLIRRQGRVSKFHLTKKLNLLAITPRLGI